MPYPCMTWLQGHALSSGPPSAMPMECATQHNFKSLPTIDGGQTSWGHLQRELLEAIFHVVLQRPDAQRDMVAVAGVCQHWRAVGNSVFFSSSWQGKEAIQHPAQLIDLCPLPLAPGGLIRGVVRRERKGWGLMGRLQRCVLYQCVPLSTGCSLLPGKFLLAAEQQHSQGFAKPAWALYMNRSCQGPPVAHLTSNALGTSYELTVAAAGSRGSGCRGLSTCSSSSSSSSSSNVCSMSSSGEGGSNDTSGGYSSSWSGSGSSALLRRRSFLHATNSISSGLDEFDAAGHMSCGLHGRSLKAGCQPRPRSWLQQVVQGPCWPASSSLTPAAAADTSADAAAAAAAAAVVPCKQGPGKPRCLGFQEGAAAAGAGRSAAGCTDAEVLLTLQYKLHFRCAVLPRRIRVALMAPAQHAWLPVGCTSRSCYTNAAGPVAGSFSRTSPLPLVPHDGSPAGQHFSGCLQQQETSCARQTVVPHRLQHQLLNKQPQWNPGLCCWSLNFNGRVKLASAKNFQLVSRPAEATVCRTLGGSQSSELHLSNTPWTPADTHIQPGAALAAPSEASSSSSASGHMLCSSSPWPEGAVDAVQLPTGLQGSPGADGIVVQFGKIDADSFILDYDPCVTNTLQAFAMALSTFGTKLLS